MKELFFLIMWLMAGLTTWLRIKITKEPIPQLYFWTVWLVLIIYMLNDFLSN